MRFFVTLCIAAITILLSGCAQVPLTSDQSDQQAKEFTPLAGHGALYIHRHEFYRVVHTFGLVVNGVSIGQTSAQTYVLLNLLPGKYVIDSHAQETSAQIEVTIEAGKNYFVWQEAQIGMVEGSRTQLHLVDEQFGRKAVLSSKRIAVGVPESRIIPLSDNKTLSAENEDPYQKIGRLKGLMDSGAITKEEYDIEKRKILK